MLTLRRTCYQPDLWNRIRSDWNPLLASSGSKSAFMAEPWVSTWIEVFGPELKPECWLFEDAERLACGIVLVSLRRERVAGLSVMSAYLNATGEGLLEAEHNAVVCRPGFFEGVVCALVTTLLDAGVELLRLRGFCSADAQEIGRQWPKGPRWGFRSNDYFVDLSVVRQDGKPYLASLSRNTREKVRKSQRIYEASKGALDCTRIKRGSSQYDAVFREMCDLHQARWVGRNRAGAFADPRVRDFHDRLSQISASDLELVRITSGLQTVGVLYMLLHEGRVNFYQSGLCYVSDGRCKPGLVAHVLAIQVYADAGHAEYDFLGGDPGEVRYKQSLSNAQRELAWQNLGVASVKMQMIALLRYAGIAVRDTLSLFNARIRNGAPSPGSTEH